MCHSRGQFFKSFMAEITIVMHPESIASVQSRGFPRERLHADKVAAVVAQVIGNARSVFYMTDSVLDVDEIHIPKADVYVFHDDVHPLKSTLCVNSGDVVT